jgi:N-acetylmuramic acid 6-phosphate etherase
VNQRPDLDLLPTDDVVALLLAAEQRVLPTVRAQSRQIADGADLIATRLSAGGRIVLVGAGTSGRLAMAEAAELPGTFGLSRSQVHGRVAGGADSTDGDEDDLGWAAADLDGLALTGADVVVAVAASGRTPYTLAIARAAHDVGAAVVAVVNAGGSPLAASAAVAIEVEVGAEVLRGSTRLTAGTAQKVALNALTTAAMVRLGRVHGDLMVDVEPANAKLQERAEGIIAEIASCSPGRAAAALQACSGNTRAAVVHLVLGLPPAEAMARAARFITLRESLRRIP